MHTTEIHIIAAMTENRLIGHQGKLPWTLPEDLRLFRELTSGGAVIMGRATFESLGGPLPGRDNFVVSSKEIATRGVTSCRSFSDAIALASASGHKLFCIGGAEIYRAALPLANFLHISWVNGEYEGDTFFPAFDLDVWQETNRQPFIGFTHVTYQRKRGQV